MNSTRPHFLQTATQRSFYMVFATAQSKPALGAEKLSGRLSRRALYLVPMAKLTGKPLSVKPMGVQRAVSKEPFHAQMATRKSLLSLTLVPNMRLKALFHL
jgi:hypothetical protein